MHTKYAYSPIKVYIPLCIAWLIQLFNMLIFILHDLDNADSVHDDEWNPLSDDKVVVIASSIYFVCDVLIILAVVFLFINPVISLLADMRTMDAKGEQGIELKTVENVNEEASSSSECVIP